MNVREEAVRILKRVFEDDAHADLLIDQALKYRSFTTSDRGLLSELVYGSIRWKGQLDWILSEQYKGKWAKMPGDVRRILEIALYQLRFLDKIPDYAVINEAVRTAKKVSAYWGGVVNAMLRNATRDADINFTNRFQDTVRAIAVEYSHPDWMIKKWMDLLGVDRTIAICRANNQRPSVCIRLNRMKGETSELLEKIRADGINLTPGKYLKDYYYLEDAGGFYRKDAFMQGLFTVQDESAGLPALMIDPKPGERILDLAAAPGGKTLHMAQLSRNQAAITSVDRNAGRLKQITENCTRLGAENVQCVLEDGTKYHDESFDKVLVDAPCSGLGVLRKRSELRWRMNEDKIEELMTLQSKLLSHASALLKDGGILVYSTCTVSPEENCELICRFLMENLSFQIEDASPYIPEIFINSEQCVETWTDLHDIDGSFAVRMRKII